MSQVGTNNPEQVGGEFMIQDRDHMGGQGQQAKKANRQADQSQDESRQHGAAGKGDKTRRQNH